MAENIMTELERYELLMKTPIGNLLTEEAKSYLLERGFFRSPASTKYHGAYEGGLFDHCFMVMNFLVELSAKNDLHWKRAESPFIIGMFHDLCKIDQYRHPVMAETLGGEVIYDESHWEYNPKTDFKGHGDKSIILLSQLMKLTEEEIMCIRYHMGAFVEKDEWRDYTGAVHKYPNVLWTHHADMLASHVVGV